MPVFLNWSVLRCSSASCAVHQRECTYSMFWSNKLVPGWSAADAVLPAAVSWSHWLLRDGGPEERQRSSYCCKYCSYNWGLLCVYVYTCEKIEAMDVLKDSWLLDRRWTSPWVEPESRMGPDWLLAGGRWLWGWTERLRYSLLAAEIPTNANTQIYIN